MARLLTLILAVASLWLFCAVPDSSVAAAASGTADDPVEITDEPMHTVRFKNHLIRVYEALIPGDSATLYHRHALSGLGIDLTTVRLSINKVGAGKQDVTSKSGEFFPVNGVPPYVHRVVNIDDQPYRVVVAERFQPVMPSAELSTLIGVKAYRLELETELVRAYQLTIAPGASTEIHTVRANTLIVSVSGGQVAVSEVGKPSRLLSLAPGDLEWTDHAQSLVITNQGVAEYIAGFLEWK